MYRSRFLQDKTPGPIHTNDYERAWLNRIPPEHRVNLRQQLNLDQAEEYFRLFLPEVPRTVWHFCWYHA